MPDYKRDKFAIKTSAALWILLVLLPAGKRQNSDMPWIAQRDGHVVLDAMFIRCFFDI